MAKSRTKKLREKQIREGSRNVSLGRSNFAEIEYFKQMTVKKSPTKKEKMNKNKHKKSYLSEINYSDKDNFFICPHFCNYIWNEVYTPRLSSY